VATLKAILVVVLALAGTLAILLMWMRYEAEVGEIERDAMWHRLWHERIYDDEHQ